MQATVSNTASTNAAQQASDALDLKIQSLPQELQDAVLESLQDVQLLASVLVDASYKPPVALQLNSKMRAEFAKKYYGSTVFEYRVVRYGNEAFLEKSGDKCLLEAWACSLTPEHQTILGTVRILRASGMRIMDTVFGDFGKLNRDNLGFYACLMRDILHGIADGCFRQAKMLLTWDFEDSCEKLAFSVGDGPGSQVGFQWIIASR